MTPEKQVRYDALYMDWAYRVAEMSHAVRRKVGAVLVKDQSVLDYGWNGMPAGMDNNCEHYEDAGLMGGQLVTNDEVLHAELNLFTKLLKSGRGNTSGSTLYVTLSPCMHCSKIALQSGVSEVKYNEEYRDLAGVNFLRENNVKVTKIEREIKS